MAKQTGIGVTVTVQDSAAAARAITNDIRSFNVNGSANLLETTGLDMSAIERLTGLADVEFSMNGVFNSDSNASHDVLKNYQTSARQVVVDYGTPVATFTVRFSSYNISRGDDGSLTWTATGMLSNGTVIAYT